MLRLGHELRTPLTALIGYAEAMQGEIFGPLPAPYTEHAATILAAARQMLALVDDLGDGGWAVRTVRFDATTLARDALKLFTPRAEAARITLRSRMPDAGMPITSDPRAMTQILINLLDNALKFTAAGGDVTLTLDRDGDELHLVLEDTGGGVAPAGQGLGLEIVGGLCDAIGGRFDLRTTQRGAVASVRLPFRDEV
jgi:cell cycle sensor histidine kinase DivJ